MSDPATSFEALPTILLVEDDPDIAGLVELHLGDQGYAVAWESDGPSGLRRALEDDLVLVILDVMLPGMDGLDVLRRLREERRALPVLMLTARSEELDKVLGLELGADDYLTKPFGIRELIARVKALLRRIEIERERRDPGDADEVLQYGPLRVESAKRMVHLEGRPIELTAKEFDLLLLFARHPGRVYNRQELLDQVWGYQYEGYSHTVNTHINRLRGKIEPDTADPVFVRTVWGVGYRFAEPEEIEAYNP